MKKTPLEKHIESKVCSYAKTRYGIQSIKLGSIYQADWPDRQFWFPLRPLLIEFKRQGQRPTPAQANRIKELQELGYEVHVIDNEEDGKRLIDATVKARRGM